MPSSDSRIAPVKAEIPTPPPAPLRPVADVIATCRPSSVNRERWDQVAGFVRSCALDFVPTDPARARELVRILAAFVIWCLDEGYPLDREEMLTPDNVDRYVEVGRSGYAESSRATTRAILRRVGPVITKTAPWTPPPASLNATPRARPYTPEELAAFRELPQRSDLARHRLRAVLALGAGAGLIGAEYYSSPGTDVWTDELGATHLQVRGSRARVVTVFDDWAADLRSVAEAVGPGHLLGGPIPRTDASRLWQLLKPIHFPTRTGRIDPERLRSSWIVRHLDQGTPLPVLLAAAGLKSAGVCTQLLAHLRVPDSAEAITWLTGRR